MNDHAKERFGEEIRKEAAQFLEVNSNRLSLITVTRIELSQKSDRAIVFITVFPDSQEEKALSFAKRQRGDLHQHLQKQFPHRMIPQVDVEIDRGEALRRKIDALS